MSHGPPSSAQGAPEGPVALHTRRHRLHAGINCGPRVRTCHRDLLFGPNYPQNRGRGAVPGRVGHRLVSPGERAGRPGAAAAPSPAGSPRSGRASGQRDAIPWSQIAPNFLASSPLIIPVVLIALPAFLSPQRCHMSLELTAEQQSPREGAESCSWNLQWLQLCQGPKRCRQRQQRPGLRAEPCPFAPRRPLRCPDPRRPQPPPRAPLFANSAHMGSRPRSRHLHPGCRGCCPCSEPSDGSALSGCCRCRSRASRSDTTRRCSKHAPALLAGRASL